MCYNVQVPTDWNPKVRGDTLNFLKKYNHTWIIPIYGFFYMLAFQYVERRPVRPHIIHMKIDDYIPFCEYFIIPYLLWFAFIAVTVFYFAFINKNRPEYWQLIITLGIGMTLFIIISLVYPNGQDLRPALTGDSIFIKLVRNLYKLDTPTNILPSIHVFNSVACCIAIFRHERFQKHKVFLSGIFLLTALIIMATVFLKQHTILDVFAAFALNAFCFQLLYKPKAIQQKQPIRAKA